MNIAVGDEIVALDSRPLTNDYIKSILNKERVVLSVKRRFEIIDLELVLTNKRHYPNFKIFPEEKIAGHNQLLFDAWLNK